MTAAFSQTLPSAAEIIYQLQQSGVVLWISGENLNYRIPPKKQTLKYQIQGSAKYLHEHLQYLREERAGILMDSGESYQGATDRAESMMLKEAVLKAFPEMENAILEMENNGHEPNSLKLPNGELIWNSIR